MCFSPWTRIQRTSVYIGTYSICTQYHNKWNFMSYSFSECLHFDSLWEECNAFALAMLDALSGTEVPRIEGQLHFDW